MKVRFLYSLLLAGLLIVGCGGGVEGEDVVEKSSFQMPIKENTWVRKETVRKTKDDFFSSKGKKSLEVPVNSALVAKLKTPVSLSISTLQECLDQANALDKTRHAVQNRGGVWGAYEAVMKAKPYSDYGMQLDSQTNRMVFSLQHICKNSQERKLGGWGADTVQRYESLGKEGFQNYYIELGEVLGDIDRWVRFAEFAIQSRNRQIPYSKIGESIARAKTLVDLYDDLSQRKIDDTNMQTFLTEGATLLSVINESFPSDPQLMLALQDEEILPFDDIEGEM
ncbi:MAG: hypothetical protein HOF68_04600 [Nitrospina sp.]|nr:hypothetical protein [Nitrospina sp.]